MSSTDQGARVLPAEPAPRPSPPGEPPTLLLVAGEASGDGHGAELIHALREQQPRVRIIGVGGPKMAAAGQEQLFDLSVHAVVGITQVLRHYFKFRRMFNRVLALARKENPQATVLIDYPGFNLRLAAKLRRELPGSRTIFYISPQVWAWKAGRVKSMEKILDLLLVILPFEKAWFAQASPTLNVNFVGHPMLDRVKRIEGAETDPDTVALLPGSRRSEVESHLPVLWEAARIMTVRQPGLRFVLLSPNEKMQELARSLTAQLPAPNFKIEFNSGYAVSHLSRCALAIVASGTASLECAVVGIPQIVIYRVDPLTWAIGKRLVKVNHLSMVNVMAGEEVVPELLQEKMQPDVIASHALELLGNRKRREAMKERIDGIVATLGGPGASKRAAQAILADAALSQVR
jgi:lipid-A-disaccharide synthase